MCSSPWQYVVIIFRENLRAIQTDTPIIGPGRYGYFNALVVEREAGVHGAQEIMDMEWKCL